MLSLQEELKKGWVKRTRKLSKTTDKKEQVIKKLLKQSLSLFSSVQPR